MKTILTLVLNWLWGKLIEAASGFLRRREESKNLEREQTAREKQAGIVDNIREEILAKTAAGEPISDELRQRLKDETKKLINM